MKKLFFCLALATATLLLVQACRHELPVPVSGGTGNGNPLPQTACNPDSVYFVNQVMPILATSCTMSGCHDAVTHADGVNLTSYATVRQYVIAGDPANSKLYKVIIKTNGDRMPPAPMAPLTAAQKELIRKWISQDGRNNSCVGACDTAVFTYSGAVKPVLEVKCNGCHNPANAGGNIDLSTYAAMYPVAVTGKLYVSVAHQTGYSPMPKNSAKLSDCEIRQIQRWIAAGALNN